jgi:plasmid maintenance system antidote protein VapI
MTHPLTGWLAKNNESLLQFARRIEVNPSSVQRLIYGKADVSTTLIRTVSAGTNFQVKQETLYREWLVAYSRRVAEQELTN